MLINVNKQDKCVLCRNWHDPANSALIPKSPKTGLWEYDVQKKRVCKIRNLETNANYLCKHYERKEI